MSEVPKIYTDVISELRKGVAVKSLEDGSNGWEYDAETTNKLMALAAIYLEHLADPSLNSPLNIAAPDMLAALKRLTDYSRKPTQSDWQAADDAIAKAIAPKSCAIMDDANLLADANNYYSATQLEEIARQAEVKCIKCGQIHPKGERENCMFCGGNLTPLPLS